MIPSKTIKLFKKIARSIAPPPKLTVSEWADNYRKLSSESSAEPGQWRTSRAPYQREIMDAASDPTVETVVVMSSAQVGKTELILNALGYYVDYDPAPMLLIMPTDEMAQALSKDRLEPMMRDTPTLAEKAAEAKAKDKHNTIKHKKFVGGSITLIGANSPAQLSSRPIRILFADEIDRFPVSAGNEGDPLALASKRTTTFWNKKHIYTSTPTIKDVSRIEREYNSSSMEQWELPCPNCKEHQALLWEQVKFTRHSEDNIEVHGMMCVQCGMTFKEHEWKAEKGRWNAKHPERKTKRGFHLNELASPWKTWLQIVQDFLEAKKSPETLKTWVNTSLGKTWEEYGELDMDELLAKRREQYNCEVPQNVLVLTCGVDVQDNRLEYEVIGWGVDYESWGIRYGIIMGDPGQAYVWNRLDEVLNQKFIRVDGQALQVMTTCIDSGGHYTQETYVYCKNREMKRVWAIKGQGGSGVPFIQRPSRRNQAGTWLFTIGVDVGKDTITSRLKVNFPGPGFCHFPIELDRGYDQQYFEGLTSEKRVINYQKGKPVIRWEKKSSSARNEPFDLRNYATAALEILNPNLDLLHDHLNNKKTVVSTPSKRRFGKVSKGVDF